MEAGSSSKTLDGGSRRSPEASRIEPFIPRRDHNPKDLRSWAKRTGFVSVFSGEATEASAKDTIQIRNKRSGLDLEKGIAEKEGSLSPKIEIDPVLGRTRAPRGIEIEPVSGSNRGSYRNGRGGNLGLRDGGLGTGENEKRRVGVQPVLGSLDEERRAELNGNSNGSHVNGNGNGNGHGVSQVTPAAEPKKDDCNGGSEAGINFSPDAEEPILGRLPREPEVKCGVMDNPGFAPLAYYSIQHYLSLAGSLVFIPLIMVPAMGGTDKDTANVISTMLLVSGITTILHSYFGTRLPLVQGSSFVYLAPALIIANSAELRNLAEHKFRRIMRELQGAIIIGSIFQSILGFSGLMSLLLRWINPIVVASTVVAVGLAFFSYGFPQAGSCVEISVPQILLVLIFTLYLRGISISGHRIFRIYAVPLSVVIIWAYAFFLTAGGAYNYKGCSPYIPTSNILLDSCRKHSYTMRHCRTDVSNAWQTSAWVRIPYPLQWGLPVFQLRTSMIMIIVSLVSSVDSVGTYHLTSLQANSKPPTPGIVSRGIGIEGFCSILAGLWGTGTGSTTLTENVHTINVTKVANRKAVQLGAVLLILFSFIGKVGGILASIPQALAASVLCFTWALIVALGLSTLPHSRASSFRNMAVVGVSLFLGLSIPAYFQQYQPESSLILPGYLVPYAAASSGPVHTGSIQLDFAINGLLSMNMVVTFFIAFLLDNTVPGSGQEARVYAWSSSEDLETDPASLENYTLPKGVAGIFRWAKCLGI
ncbi:Nucleobase-ascorbate transporter 11 [Ancistrocladus abbreviatus]